MFYLLFTLLSLILVAENVEVVIGEMFRIRLLRGDTGAWVLDERETFVGYVSFIDDYADPNYQDFSIFVFKAIKVGYTTLTFSWIPIEEIYSRSPSEYQIHIIEKPDTSMISPAMLDTGMIHPVHKPLEVVVGSEVMIGVIENPSTGYTWNLFDESYTVGGFLSYVSDTMIMMEDGKQNAGEHLVHRFVFRGEKCGTTRVRFVQARFGEVDASAVPESYFVHVVEKPDTGMISPDKIIIHPVHKPLQVVVGSEVVIDMVENPTTGYTWRLFDESYATGGFLSYISDFRVEMDGGEENKFGTPSIHRFVFRGEKSGSTKVVFVQVRFGVRVEVGADPKTYFIRVVEKPNNTGIISL